MSLDIEAFQEVAATLYDLIESTTRRASASEEQETHVEVADILNDMIEATHSKVSLVQLRNAIIECKDGVISKILDETPYLLDRCIESTVKGNYPIHWATVAINGSCIGQDCPLASLSSILQRETNVDRKNFNGATALHLISTQYSDERRRLEIMGEVTICITMLLAYIYTLC